MRNLAPYWDDFFAEVDALSLGDVLPQPLSLSRLNSIQRHVQDRCFGENSQGLDGAADLLEVLAQSLCVEMLAFNRCSHIPAAAWQRVPSGAWPKLNDDFGIPKKELPRLRGQGLSDLATFWGGTFFTKASYASWEFLLL